MEMEIDISKSRKEEVECVLVQAVAKVALAPTPRRSWAELASEVMHNELVMSNIARKLPSYALLDLRETCTLWNNQFIPEVQKNHKAVELKWSDSDPWSSRRGAFDFTKVMKSSSKIPFSRYRISESPGIDRLARYKLYKFMSTLGNTITRLFLEWPVDDLPIEQLRRIIFQLTPELSELFLQPFRDPNDQPESPASPASTHEKHPNCGELATSLPKLRQIRVIRWDEDASQGLEFTQLVSDTIQCASGLEFLELRDYGSSGEDFIRTNLARLLNDGTQIHKLKTLVLFNSKAEDLQILIQLARQDGNSLQLHTLKSEKSSGGSRRRRQGIAALFHIFLETQSPTLKCLKVCLSKYPKDRNETTRHIRIPQMAHLTQLRIRNWALPREEMVFGKVVFEDVLASDSFVDTFPELRQFACNFTEDLDRLHHPRVQELTLKIDIRHLIRFYPVFPFLTRLKLDLTSKNREDIEDYTGIWTTWPNLTVLHLTGTIICEDMDFDSFLTGVPRLKLKTMMQDLASSVAIQKQPVDSSVILDTLHSILDKYKTEAGIRDLKKLRDLKIHTHGQKTPKYRGHRLTDIGGHFGVGLASPCLKRVFISGSARNMVSEKCRAFIKTIFGLGLEIMF